jgi:hypothetical protein
VIAFSKFFMVRMLVGTICWPIMATANFPVRSATRSRADDTEGGVADPKGLIPIASARHAMVDAVPITPHVCSDREMSIRYDVTWEDRLPQTPAQARCSPVQALRCRHPQPCG